MYARALAADLMVRTQPDRYRIPKDRYVSKYPAPYPPPKALLEVLTRQQPARTDGLKLAVATSALIGLIASFAMHLVNLRMQNLGITGSLISLTVAAQAFAICGAALIGQQVVAKFGLRSTLPTSSTVCAVALVLIFFQTDVYLITVLRVVFAIGLTFLLIASEYLVTFRSNETNRGRVIAWYTTALGAGAIAGPLFASVMGIELSTFLICAAMLLFGSAALGSCLDKYEGKTLRRNSPYAAIAFMPAAFLAAFLFGVADNGGLSMLPVYGALNGYDNSSAANLAVFAAIGATLLQFPIGWLATKRSTTELLLILCVCSLCLLALLPIVIGNKWTACLVAVGLGGIIEGLYTIGLIKISRDRRTQNLSAMNACFISVCSFGEVVGPVASSVSMHYFGPDGLVVALLVVFAAYALGMVNRLRPTASNPMTFN